MISHSVHDEELTGGESRVHGCAINDERFRDEPADRDGDDQGDDDDLDPFAHRMPGGVLLRAEIFLWYGGLIVFASESGFIMAYCTTKRRLTQERIACFDHFTFCIFNFTLVLCLTSSPVSATLEENMRRLVHNTGRIVLGAVAEEFDGEFEPDKKLNAQSGRSEDR